jgi:hypothetical protein
MLETKCLFRLTQFMDIYFKNRERLSRIELASLTWQADELPIHRKRDFHHPMIDDESFK